MTQFKSTDLIEDYYYVIGKIVVNFQALEYMVHDFYYTLIGEKFDYSEQYQVRFSEFIKKFKNKVKEKYGTDIEYFFKIEKLIEDINLVNNKRNDIVHSSWIVSNYKNKDSIIKFKRKSSFNMNFKIINNEVFLPNDNCEYWTIDDVNSIYAEIEVVKWRLLSFVIIKSNEKTTK